MQNYQFRSSKLCIKELVWLPEENPLVHLLPPNPDIPRHEITARKESDVQELLEKNNQLMALVNQKQMERAKISHNYEELLMMYEQVKTNGMTRNTQLLIQQLEQDKRVLIEQIHELEHAVKQSENELTKRVKFYEQKNEESRRLLQKLNHNITKREQKFKEELQDALHEIEQKNDEIQRLRAQQKEVLEAFQEKEDELTNHLQQTERERFSLSENMSTLEGRLQAENTRLKLEVSEQNDLISSMERKFRQQGEMKLSQIREQLARYKSRAEQLEEGKASQEEELERLKEHFDELSNNFNYLELEHKNIEGSNRLNESEVKSLRLKLQACEAQNKVNLERSTSLASELRTLHREKQLSNREVVGLSEKILNLNTAHQQLKIQLQQCQHSLQESNQRCAELQSVCSKQKSDAQVKIYELLDSEKKIGALLAREEKQKMKISNLELLLQQYKAEKVRMGGQIERKWKEMVAFYEKEIQKVEGRVQERQSAKSMRKSETSYFKHASPSFD